MKNILCGKAKIFSFFLLSTLLYVPISRTQDASPYDKCVQSYVSNNDFMGTVIVARGNDILFNKGFGSANLEWDIPNTPTTRFRIGSITKQFTAASILILEEKGKLNIDDPIKNYLPDIPDAWDKITIFHLLTHSAGIPDYFSIPEHQKDPLFSHTPEEIVGLFRDKPLDFEPGETFRYSNSGYVLLGYLLEKVSGETYQDFIQKNIFDPLGMKDSGYDSNSAIIPRRAAGYSPGPSGVVNAGFIHMTVPYSAGALYSTTGDLLRWNQGLFGGKLLSRESLTKMITPYKGDYKGDYAFGLYTGTDNGHRFLWHGGWIKGFATHLSYYPDDKITVAVLSNVNCNAPRQLSRKLAAVTRGE